MEWAETQGIGTMTYGSLGGGILTGAIRELPKPDPKDMRQVFYPFFKEPLFSNVMELLKDIRDKNCRSTQCTGGTGIHQLEYPKEFCWYSINWS